MESEVDKNAVEKAKINEKTVKCAQRSSGKVGFLRRARKKRKIIAQG